MGSCRRAYSSRQRLPILHSCATLLSEISWHPKLGEFVPFNVDDYKIRNQSDDGDRSLVVDMMLRAHHIFVEFGGAIGTETKRHGTEKRPSLSGRQIGVSFAFVKRHSRRFTKMIYTCRRVSTVSNGQPTQCSNTSRRSCHCSNSMST